MALSLFGDTAMYIVLPTHTAQAGILLVDVGLMLSANRLIRIFINGPYGLLIERWPRRRVLIISQLIGAGANALYLVTGFWPLLIGRLLWGVAWAGIWIGGNTSVLDVAEPHNRGWLVGRYHMWGFVGFMAGALAGGLTTDALGYHAAFALGSLTSLAAAGLWLVMLPETRPDSASVKKAHSLLPLPATVTRAPVITAIVLMGVNWLIFLGVIGAVLPLLLQQRIGSALMIGALVIPIATFTGIVAALKDVTSLITAPLSGWLSDWLRDRWRLITLSVVTGCIALVMIATGFNLALIAGIMLAAATTSMLQTQVTAVVGDYAGMNRQGRMLGVLNIVGDMGSAAGPLLAFALINPDGLNWSLGTVFFMAAGLLLLNLPWVGWISWRERRVRSLLPT